VSAVVAGRRGRVISAVAAGVIAIGCFAGAVATSAAYGIPETTYRDNDFSQYYAGARALVSGRSPYGDAFWSEIEAIGGRALFAKPYATVADAGLTTPYPLFVFVLLAPIGALPLPIAASTFLMSQLSALVVALSAVGRRVLDASRGGALVFALIAVAFEPLWLVLTGGNLAGLVAAFFAGAVAAALGGRPRLAGALLGLCLVKPQAVLFAGAVMLVALDPASRRRAMGAFATVGVILVAAAFVVDPSWVGAWWRNVTALQATTGSNATAWTIDRALGTPRWTGPLAVLIALAGFVAWWRIARPKLAGLIAAAIPVSLFVAPHAWSYDGVILLVSVAVVLARLHGRIGVERWMRLALVLLVAVALPWAAYVLAVRRGGEEWTALLFLLFFALVAIAAPREAARGAGGRTAARPAR
jgi:glycosyl transferase family 87